MSPRTGGATAYRGPHNPQPDGRCRHRWANRVTRDVHCGYPAGWAEAIAARDAELRARFADAFMRHPTGRMTDVEVLALLDQPVVPKP